MKRSVLALMFALMLASPALADEKEIGLEGLPEAPIAATPAAPTPDWMKYNSPYAADKDSIAKANHTSDEIMAWSGRAVSDVLTFKDKDFMGQIKRAQTFFNQAGWGEYAAYLKDSKLLEAGQSGKYVIATITDGPPMILDSGPLNGAWHWIISVPVITSVAQGGVPAADAQVLSSRKARIKLTITRVLEGGDDGLAVEGWTLMP